MKKRQLKSLFFIVLIFCLAMFAAGCGSIAESGEASQNLPTCDQCLSLAVLDVGKTNCMKRIDLITGCRTCKEPDKYGMKKGIIC